VAVAQNVGPQAAAMRERPQDAGAREALEVRARLAAALAKALHRADAKAAAAQGIEIDAAHDQVAPRLDGLESRVLEHLGRHPRSPRARNGQGKKNAAGSATATRPRPR